MGVAAEYPEHDKLRALGGANQTVGEFIDWLHANGMTVAKYGYPVDMQVFVSVRHMGSGERRRLLEVVESRDMEAIVEWLEERDYVDQITVAPYFGWGYDSFTQRVALPHPEFPAEPWAYTHFDRSRLWEQMESTEQMIGRFFGIDPAKLSAEKDAILAAIRAA